MKIAQLARLEFLSRVETPNDIRVHLVGLALQGFFTSSAHNYINPPEATNKIFSFVELLLKQIHDNPANINLWANGISAPEFYNEETEGSEFDGLEDFEQE